VSIGSTQQEDGSGLCVWVRSKKYGVTVHRRSRYRTLELVLISKGMRPLGRCRCRWETHILYYLLSPWSRVLGKLTGSQFKKFPAFYGTWSFITAFTSTRHPSLSCARTLQSMPPAHPTSWRSVLILSSHLRLGLKSVYQVYSVRNYVTVCNKNGEKQRFPYPCHEATLILNLGTRRRRVVGFTHRPLCPQKNPGSGWLEGWLGRPSSH
jgi:hypothetical protein